MSVQSSRRTEERSAWSSVLCEEVLELRSLLYDQVARPLALSGLSVGDGVEFGPSVFPLRSGMTDWMKLHLGLTLNDLNRNELGAAERDLCI